MLNLRIIMTNRIQGISFVPCHSPVNSKDIEKLQEFIDNSTRLLVLTGAGISTESGIPDYSSKGVGLYARSSVRPVHFKDFMCKETVRKRYWARNYIGWPRFSSLKPNINHICLSNWEKHGKLFSLVTQNVDRLHHKSGTENVIELHGTTYRVKCMNCGYKISRFLFQQILKYLNPDLQLEAVEVHPDDDELDSGLLQDFQVADCERCGGILKPDVVFFGDTVPKERVEEVYQKVTNSDAVLAIGSSLKVISGYRFVLAAVEQNKPVAVLNIGPTRADHICNLKICAKCSDILPRIFLNNG
ncbi:NAD-dependent protein deacylase Sirt4-like [Limulus polyphemus]|uniref:NAD-dependent protein deacylase Sirt4-like n=1 Tax=Limulus polyphemus TaxID=6850 RepID=A0ABM1BNH0_LIMPO|nr:NAD-dependent protein deacylase Sirt4-like [Limulus polyphemus]